MGVAGARFSEFWVWTTVVRTVGGIGHAGCSVLPWVVEKICRTENSGEAVVYFPLGSDLERG